MGRAAGWIPPEVLANMNETDNYRGREIEIANNTVREVAPLKHEMTG
jgi:hypothetical protein